MRTATAEQLNEISKAIYAMSDDQDKICYNINGGGYVQNAGRDVYNNHNTGSIAGNITFGPNCRY